MPASWEHDDNAADDDEDVVVEGEEEDHHHQAAASLPTTTTTTTTDKLFSTFIFPRSDEYATRDYQLNIITKALVRNTLVVLPTGLGKTFIAAVVMYNYLRWFPGKKVIFLAPTKPLVRQQIQACHDVMGIPETETAEMNGQTSGAKRAELWRTKRVFYCTPQTLEKDMEREDTFPMMDIALIVIDEAHRAVGKYAFATTVNKLFTVNPKFRVLALSATPGKDLPKVQEVCTSLLISNIEYKSENDFDVKPYVFQKLIQMVMCELSPVNTAVVEDFTKLVEIPLRRISQLVGPGVALPSARTISKYEAVAQMNALSSAPHLTATQRGALLGEWGLVSSLLHVKELFRNGMSTALAYLESTFKAKFGAKSWGSGHDLVHGEPFAQFMRKLRASVAAGEGNPKVTKLSQVLRDHFARFAEGGKRTSVIIFAQFRDSVAEICQALKVSCPALRVCPFVGQANKGGGSSSGKKSAAGSSEKKKAGKATSSSSKKKKKKPASSSDDDDDDDDDEEEDEDEEEEAPASLKPGQGQKQSEQQEVVRKFRNGELDVIVATCIGEEGLDIGSVDLVVSFDALGSPVRMIQRFGRAGRKRAGHVMVLLADEKEKQGFESGKKQSKRVDKLLRDDVWKLKLFVPPSEFCMFPSPTHRPVVSFQKLEISQYQSDLVGGTKPRSKAANADDSAGRDWAQLTVKERDYLAARFATVGGEDGESFEDAEQCAAQQARREPTGEFVKRWRFAPSGMLVSTSSRSKLVQHVARLVAADMAALELDSARSLGEEEEEEDDVLGYSINTNLAEARRRELVLAAAKYASDTTVAVAAEVEAKAEEVSTDDGNSPNGGGGGGGGRTTDDGDSPEEVAAAAAASTPPSARNDDDDDEEDEFDFDGEEEEELIPEPPSEWDSGQEDEEDAEDLDCFPEIVTPSRKAVGLLLVPPPPPPQAVVVAPIVVMAANDEASQSPFVPRRKSSSSPAAASKININDDDDDDDSQSPFMPRRASSSSSSSAAAAAAAARRVVDDEKHTPQQQAGGGRRKLVLSQPTPISASSAADTPILRKRIKSTAAAAAAVANDEEEEDSSPSPRAKRQPPPRDVRRARLVRNAFLSQEAECDDDEEEEDGEDEGAEDLDADLDSFIDDSTPQKKKPRRGDEEDEDTGGGSAHGSAQSSCFSSTPVDRIRLVHKSSRVSRHYGGGVIQQTLDGLRHRMENGLAPPVVEDDEEEEEEEEEGEEEEDDDDDDDFVQVVEEKKPAAAAAAAPLPRPPATLSAFFAPPVSAAATTTTTTRPLTPPPPASALPLPPPPVAAAAAAKPPALSNDLQMHIELKRRQALEKLSAKTAAAAALPPAPPLALMMTSAARSPPPPSVASPLLLMPSSSSQPVRPLHPFPPPPAAAAVVAPPLAAPSFSPPPPPPTTVTPAPPSSSPSSTSKPPVLLFNHASAFSAPLIRSLNGQFDVQMCPHIDFHGADAILSTFLSIKILSATLLVQLGGSGELEAFLRGILQRTPQVIVVLFLSDEREQHVYDTSPVAKDWAGRLRSQAFPGVQCPVIKSSSTVELGKLLLAFTKREEKRRLVFTGETSCLLWRQVLWKCKLPIEFLARLPASNVVIALALLLHFSKHTMHDLVQHTTVDLLCARLAPDVPRAQAAALVAGMQQQWPAHRDRLGSMYLL